MVLFHQVNGVKLQMSAQEEQEIRAKWAENDARKELEKGQRAADKVKKLADQKSLMTKLGITQEEFDLLSK